MVREIQDSSGDHIIVLLRDNGGCVPPPPGRNSQPASTPFFRALKKEQAQKRAAEMKRWRERKLAQRRAKAMARKNGKN